MTPPTPDFVLPSLTIPIIFHFEQTYDMELFLSPF